MEIKERRSTKDVILEQLTENTGRALCDSGGAYGRNWERNQGKTWEYFTKDPVTLEASVYAYNGDRPQLEFMATISLAVWMENNLEFSDELQSAFDEFVATRPEDEHWLEMMEEFARKSGASLNRWSVGNSYNEDNDLSQNIPVRHFRMGGCRWLRGYLRVVTNPWWM
jgi:hypothetical protein